MFPSWSRQPALGRGPLRMGRLSASPRLPGCAPRNGRQGAVHDMVYVMISYNCCNFFYFQADSHEIWQASYLYPSDIV